MRILLVEDDDFIRAELVERLLCHSIESEMACDADQALDILESNFIDLIVTDIEMPGLSGIGFANKVREMPSLLKSRIPIIAITGSYDFTNHSTYGLGFSAVFVKPFDLSELVNAIYLFGRQGSQQALSVGNDRIHFIASKMTLLREQAESQELTANESRLMAMFIEKNTLDLSIEDIYQNIWQTPKVGKRFSALLHNLRKKLKNIDIDLVHLGDSIQLISRD